MKVKMKIIAGLTSEVGHDFNRATMTQPTLRL